MAAACLQPPKRCVIQWRFRNQAQRLAMLGWNGTTDSMTDGARTDGAMTNDAMTAWHRVGSTMVTGRMAQGGAPLMTSTWQSGGSGGWHWPWQYAKVKASICMAVHYPIQWQRPC